MIEVNPWQRKGHKRLYVNDDGNSLGYLDLVSGCIVGDEPAVREALSRYGISAPLQLADDLACQLPGAGIAELGGNYEVGARAEMQVAGLLSVLTSFGYRMLHGVKVGPRADVDHLLIGPSGVHPVNTKFSSKAIDLSRLREDWIQRAEHHDEIVSQRLSSATGVRIEAYGFIAVVAETTEASDLAVPAESLPGRIRSLPVAIDSAVVEALFCAARNPRTWGVAL